jgi:hypothetical protein
MTHTTRNTALVVAMITEGIEPSKIYASDGVNSGEIKKIVYFEFEETPKFDKAKQAWIVGSLKQSTSEVMKNHRNVMDIIKAKLQEVEG